MKNTIKLLVLSVFFMGNVAFAHELGVELPPAGFTPSSPFYFLDKLSESLKEFLTFNPEKKAQLQVSLALERVSEIKAILEEKGINAKGLDVAEERLQSNFAKVNSIIAKEKAKGKDVESLAKDLDSDLDGPKDALEKAFETEKKNLENKEKELKASIREAVRFNDTAKVEALTKELANLKAQRKSLEDKKDDNEDRLGEEEDKLEIEMNDEVEAVKNIREAEKAKIELLNEVTDEGTVISLESFKKFDQLIAQARELLDKGNFQGAKQLAKQAKKSLEAVKDGYEDERELRKDTEEDMREIEKEMDENQREDAKRAEELRKELED